MSKKDCEFCNGSSFFEFDEGEVQMQLHNEDITFSSGNGTKSRKEYYLPVKFCPMCGNKLSEATEWNL